MKLIHTADLHLGSRMESKFPPDKAKRRRTELRDSFARMIDRAKELHAEIILIAGDAFDADPATPADRAFFFDAVAKAEENPAPAHGKNTPVPTQNPTVP